MYFYAHMDMIWHGVDAIEVTLLILTHAMDIGVEFALVLFCDGALRTLCTPDDVICEGYMTHGVLLRAYEVLASSQWSVGWVTTRNQVRFPTAHVHGYSKYWLPAMELFRRDSILRYCSFSAFQSRTLQAENAPARATISSAPGAFLAMDMGLKSV